MHLMYFYTHALTPAGAHRLLLSESGDVQTGAHTAVQSFIATVDHPLHHCGQDTKVVKHLQGGGHLSLVLGHK